MDASPEGTKRYELYFVLDGKRFFWSNPNCGIGLVAAGRDSRLVWETEGREESELWTGIVSVGMTSASDGKSQINQCRIEFRDGRALTVTDAGSSGTLDESKTPIYRDFVRALHARLAKAPAGTIAFRAGASERRYFFMRIVLVIAVLFFVGIPLGLLFFVHEWQVLGILFAGSALVWPFWRIVQNNRPRSYDPRHPPVELME